MAGYGEWQNGIGKEGQIVKKKREKENEQERGGFLLQLGFQNATKEPNRSLA